jgi:hypothetical protein
MEHLSTMLLASSTQEDLTVGFSLYIRAVVSASRARLCFLIFIGNKFSPTSLAAGVAAISVAIKEGLLNQLMQSFFITISIYPCSSISHDSPCWQSA